MTRRQLAFFAVWALAIVLLGVGEAYWAPCHWFYSLPKRMAPSRCLEFKR